MDNTINTSSYINNYTNYCFYRLPCGICQRTNSMCPLAGGTSTPTWTPKWEVTCTTGAVGTDDYREVTCATGTKESENV